MYPLEEEGFPLIDVVLIDLPTFAERKLLLVKSIGSGIISKVPSPRIPIEDVVGG
jgi:hypothetical protein